MSLNVVLAGGGTAGHVNPLIATADALTRIDPSITVTAVGTQSGLETQLVPAAGYDLETITRVPFPRRLNKEAASFIRRFRNASKEAAGILKRSGADVVVGFGGYASTPVYRAAKKLGIPVIVHEGNARPGMANKWGARLSDVVALTFPSTPLESAKGLTICTGLPLRAEIGELANSDRAQRRKEAAERFGLDPRRPVILVTGGSSGAQKLNEVISSIASEFGDKQVLHVTGKDKDGPVRESAAGNPDYHVLDYLTDMENAYAVADLVITRAGAGMVAEVSSLGIPAVFVPLPVGNGEQALNAQDVVRAGGALLVTNKQFTAQWIRDNVWPLFDGHTLHNMSRKASGVSPLDAADRLAKLIIKQGSHQS